MYLLHQLINNVRNIPRRNKISKFQGQSQTPIFLFIVQRRVSLLNCDCFKRQQVVQSSRCCVQYRDIVHGWQLVDTLHKMFGNFPIGVSVFCIARLEMSRGLPDIAGWTARTLEAIYDAATQMFWYWWLEWRKRRLQLSQGEDCSDGGGALGKLPHNVVCGFTSVLQSYL